MTSAAATAPPQDGPRSATAESSAPGTSPVRRFYMVRAPRHKQRGTWHAALVDPVTPARWQVGDNPQTDIRGARAAGPQWTSVRPRGLCRSRSARLKSGSVAPGSSRFLLPRVRFFVLFLG